MFGRRSGSQQSSSARIARDTDAPQKRFGTCAGPVHLYGVVVQEKEGEGHLRKGDPIHGLSGPRLKWARVGIRFNKIPNAIALDAAHHPEDVPYVPQAAWQLMKEPKVKARIACVSAQTRQGAKAPKRNLRHMTQQYYSKFL